MGKLEFIFLEDKFKILKDNNIVYESTVLDFQNKIIQKPLEYICESDGIKKRWCYIIIKHYELKYDTYLARKNHTYSLFLDFIKDIDLKYFYDFYMSHSRKETCKKFNIGPGIFFKIKDYLEIHKDKDTIEENKKNTRILNYGSEENYKEEMNKARQQTCIKKYGVSSWTQTAEYRNTVPEIQKKLKQTVLEKYRCENVFQNEEIKEKARQTKLEKYGDERYTNASKASETMLERYGVKNYCLTEDFKEKKNLYREEHKEELQEKLKQTMLERYGVDNIVKSDYYKKIIAEKQPEINRKRNLTKRANSSFNKSELENILFEALVEVFGAENVIRQYYDSERYPFNCDFYVVSEDLFIELNNFPTHGSEPFDPNNEEHQKLLLQYKESPKNWIEQNKVKIWAHSDVLKIDTAKNNKLNYLLLYSREDVYKFIDSIKNKPYNKEEN